MLNFTSEDISRDAWLAAAWKQEWESAGPSRVHRYIWDPGDGAIGGDDLPRRQWTTLNHFARKTCVQWKTILAHSSAWCLISAITRMTEPAPPVHHGKFIEEHVTGQRELIIKLYLKE
ncbi:hypothetical protein AAFF_G00209740 [Aldrovandia affinis]|uniref:Uncharacterized protein n=1 Tax=Aldrovandia affinis TaxID=143900 RepID=A0AAD7WUW9_9TELE|nr:hypothetical protein AAFF_G00209740 [Aldrovandia affinis]